jgi:5,10-methylenetetrahydromethanopterin reductase
VTASPMRVGLINPDPVDLPGGVQRAVRTLVTADRFGVDGVWTSQEWGSDALTILGLLASRTSFVRLGTAIVPMWTRHPFSLAQEALTLQEACEGRLSLGVGPSHPQFIEPLGIPYRDVMGFVTEYLRVLTDLVRDQATDFEGKHFRVGAQIHASCPPVPILLSALGPRMLNVAGRFADGTVTFLASPDYIRRVVRPRIDESASRNSRPRPRVVAAVQVAVTSTPEEARQMIKIKLADYARRPGYRRLLAASRIAGPEDLLLAGNLEQVAEGLQVIYDSGADEVILEPVQGLSSTHDWQWVLEITRHFQSGTG